MIPPVFDGTLSLTVQRMFPAPRERVFRAWTEREALQQWFRPGSTHITVNKLDVHVGGSFCFDLVDGSDSLVGNYLEIVRPERLVFTWLSLATQGKDTLVKINFIEHGPLTQIILVHEQLSSKAMCTLHQAGWESVLSHLAAVVH
jgi:uncharacterized protein YndB with AHSA1/START domain